MKFLKGLLHKKKQQTFCIDLLQVLVCVIFKIFEPLFCAQTLNRICHCSFQCFVANGCPCY